MASATQISPSSVFLVSGGAKGITGKCVTRLVQHQPCTFVLLGRSSILDNEPDWAKNYSDESQLKKLIMEDLLAKGGKPSPMAVQKVFRSIISSREIKNTLRAIERAGGQAEYIDVDITDISALQQKLEATISRMGPITGIIHGAGNLADKLIEKKTEEDFETVYTAKVKGLENLLSCIPVSQLDYLVLFSSVSGFFGNIGQTDYAMANEILNKSAHLVKQHNPSCHVVAINWGPWDSGMVSPELKNAFAQRNIEIIPIEVGAQMMVDELNIVNQKTAQVVIGSPVFIPVSKLNPQLETHSIRRRLTLEANPFLQDHVIAGNPVLPATCAISWIANACEQLYPGYKFFSCINFRILKGIIFNESLANEYVLDIKEIAKNSSEIEFEAKVWSRSNAGKIHYHYSCQLKLLRDILSAPIHDSFDLTIDPAISNFDRPCYQDGELSLFHGPAFQAVENVINITPERITTRLKWKGVEEKKQGQFPIQTINPYVIDLQFHSVWIWLCHFHKEICLPALLEKFEHFADIPCDETFYVSAEVKSKTETSLITDITSHDLHGKVYSRFLGAKTTIFSLKLPR